MAGEEHIIAVRALMRMRAMCSSPHFLESDLELTEQYRELAKNYFQQFHASIRGMLQNDPTGEYEQLTADVEQTYMRLQATIAKQIKVLQAAVALAEVPAPAVAVRELPIVGPFNGEATRWGAFRTKFEEQVHTRNGLSHFDKFKCLREALTGIAATLLQERVYGEEQYEEQWKKVCDYFDDTYEQEQRYLNAILDFDSLGHNPTGAAVRALRRELTEHAAAAQHQPKHGGICAGHTGGSGSMHGYGHAS